MSQENATQEKSVPTKEELIQFFQEQIDVKKVQYELQELNTKLAVARAEELKALSFIGQITNPKADDNAYEGQGTPHTITEEDLANNPELVEEGLKVGDQVLIPNQEAPSAPAKKRGLKNK